MQGLSSEKGTKYITSVIENLSKLEWAIPIRNKSGKQLLTAF